MLGLSEFNLIFSNWNVYLSIVWQIVFDLTVPNVAGAWKGNVGGEAINWTNSYFPRRAST